jgi:hypothetical protein
MNDYSQCPIYDKCVSAREVLPREFCAEHRCNTFYQIDTIQICLDYIAELNRKHSNGNADPLGIARKVEDRKL